MAKDSIYQVTANGFSFPLTSNTIESADILSTNSNSYNIVHQHRSVTATIVSADFVGKQLTVEVEGNHFTVEIKDELDLVLEKMGFNLKAEKQVKDIKAPMPGLVLSVNVTEGQSINKGDKLLILEAMKMENSILADVTATVKRILVKPGQAVDKGQILVELD